MTSKYDERIDDGDVIPGAAFPWATNENNAEDWNYCIIQKCDECAIYDDDEAAALAVCESLNNGWALLDLPMLRPGDRFVPVTICGVRGENTYNVALGVQRGADLSVELVCCKDAAKLGEKLKTVVAAI